MKKDKTEKDLICLLAECGMISRDENYSHKAVRQFVAQAIRKMQPCAKEALINTLQFLLYEHKGD